MHSPAMTLQMNVFFNSGFKKNINRNRLLGKEAYDNLARIN
jgi:hypothetical protein